MKTEPSHGQMGSRGLTRPMAEMHIQSGGSHAGGHDEQEQEQEHEHEHGHEHEQQGKGHGMDHDGRMHMLRMHHQQTLWIYWTLPLLGCWLLLAPFNFGYLRCLG